MPDQIGKPLEKSEADKEKDRKLLEDIENDKADPKGAALEAGQQIDPLMSQALTLPTSILGADGFAPNSHVHPVEGSVSTYIEPDKETFDDDEFGGGVTDAGDLTAD